MNKKVSIFNLIILILIILELSVAGCKKAKDPREDYVGNWALRAIHICSILDLRNGWSFEPADTILYNGTVSLGSLEDKLAIHFPSLPGLDSDTLFVSLLKDGELICGNMYYTGHGRIKNDSLETIMSYQGNSVSCSLSISGQKTGTK